MSLKTIFSSTGNYQPISATDWNNINRDAVESINTREGDFNIEVDNADPHQPIISLNQNLDLQNITATETIGCTDFNATTAGVATLNVGSVANTPVLNANVIVNGTLTLPNTVGSAGLFLASDGMTGTTWSAVTSGGIISNTDGNLDITSGSTGSYNINLSSDVSVSSVSADSGSFSNLISGSFQYPSSLGLTGTIMCSNGSTGINWLKGNEAVSLTNTDGNIGILADITGSYELNLENVLNVVEYINSGSIFCSGLVQAGTISRVGTGSTGSYDLQPNCNNLDGQVLTDVGSGTLHFKYPLSVSGSNLVLSSGETGTINNLTTSSNLSADSLSLQNSLTCGLGVTGGNYQLPNNVAGVPAGAVLTYGGGSSTAFLPISLPPVNTFSYGGITALLMGNGVDSYTMPTIKFTSDLRTGLISVLFNTASASPYVVSGSDVSAPFKSVTQVDLSLRPVANTIIATCQCGETSPSPPYTISTAHTMIFSLDSDGYLYMSQNLGNPWSSGFAYLPCITTPTDMLDGTGYVQSNVIGTYQLY